MKTLFTLVHGKALDKTEMQQSCCIGGFGESTHQSVCTSGWHCADDALLDKLEGFFTDRSIYTNTNTNICNFEVTLKKL